MATLTLDLVKQHCRVDDYVDEDALLELHMAAAQQKILTDIHQDEDAVLELGDGEWPAPLVQAALLLIGHWYNQREAVASTSTSVVPHGYSDLIRPYRVFDVSTSSADSDEDDEDEESEE